MSRRFTNPYFPWIPDFTQKQHINTPKISGVFIWGWGNEGQMGNGENTEYNLLPTNLLSLPKIKQIAGGQHIVALDVNGYVYGWSLNDKGQLGIGTNTFKEDKPVQTLDTSGTGYLSNITKIAANASGTMAISTTELYAWGNNFYGEFGNGTTGSTINSIPIQITGLPGTVVDISRGYSHSVIVLDNGLAYSSGRNYDGQIGNGTTGDTSSYLGVTGISDIKNVSAGLSFTLFLTNSGDVYSVGSNIRGQLGIGTTGNVSIPTQITGFSNIKQVSAGYNHSLMVDNVGKVYAFGDNTNGQLGIGYTNQYEIFPVLIQYFVDNNINIVQISAGTYFSIALSDKGFAYAWGYNGEGELGNNTTDDTNVPVQVLGLLGKGFLKGMSQVYACDVNCMAIP